MKKEIKNIINFLEKLEPKYPPDICFDYEKILYKIIYGYYDKYENDYIKSYELIYDQCEGLDELLILFFKNLKKSKIIKDFKTVEKKYNGKNKEFIEKVFYYKITFNRKNKDIFKLFDYTSVENYKNELYGKELQKRKTAEYIIKKFNKFENRIIILRPRDDSIFIDFNDKSHIKIAKNLRILEELKYIEIHTIYYEKGYDDFKIPNFPKYIKLEIKNENALNKLLKKNPKKIKNICIQFTEDGKLLEKNSKKLIHRFSSHEKAFTICNYIFNFHEKNIFIEWDDISMEVTGLEVEDGDSIKNYKKSISDSIRLINKHSIEKLGEKIIENDGQERYKVIY